METHGRKAVFNSREKLLEPFNPKVGMEAALHKYLGAALRLKLGRSAEDDAKIVGAVRHAVGDRVKIRVDYNQAYKPADAVRAIKAIEPLGIEFAEQPVGAEDYTGMAFVQKRVGVPLMAHEGCFSLRDLLTLLELGAIRVVGINSERPGGVTNALKAANSVEDGDTLTANELDFV